MGNFLSLATIGKEEGSRPSWQFPWHRGLCPREDSTESGNDEKKCRRSLVYFAYPPPGIALDEARNVVSPLASRSSVGTKNVNDSANGSERPDSAWQQASWLSRLFFTWPYPLLKLGMQRTLTDADLPSGVETDFSDFLLNDFNRIWKEEQQQHPDAPSLWRAIANNFFNSVPFAQLLLAVEAAAKVAQAVVLGKLIESFVGTNDRGYLWAGLLVLCGVVILVAHHHLLLMT